MQINDRHPERWKNQPVSNLRRLLKMRRMRQVELANKLGVSHITVSKWVTGKNRPNEINLRLIANLLQCEPEEVSGTIDVMTTRERDLLAAFRSLSDEKQAAVMAMVGALGKPSENPLAEKLAGTAKKSD